jgi:hypothetical protein
MRVLLVNPWIHDFSAYDLWIQPLGLLYLAGVLKDHEIETDYIDCIRNVYHARADGRGKFVKQEIPTPAPLKGIKRKYGRYGITVQEFRERAASLPVPETILLTSGMTYWYPGVQETIRELRTIFPRTRIILGGIYATLMPDHARTHSGADLVVSTQSENTIVELITGSPGRQYSTLDDYPYPAWDLTGETRYRVLMTSRGCPYRCTFCASDILNEQRFALRSPENVLHEIETYYYNNRITQFVFYDDALLIRHKQHFERIIQGVLDRGIAASFHTPNGLNAREIDEPVADLMYRSGFRTIRLSLESANPEIQKVQSNNKVSNQLFTQAIRNLYRAGYGPGEIECYLIMGLPGQTPQDVRDSLNFVRDLGVLSRLAVFSPIPGTVEGNAAMNLIGDAFLREPLLQNHSCFPLKDATMTDEELQSIKMECNRNNESIRNFTACSRSLR